MSKFFTLKSCGRLRLSCGAKEQHTKVGASSNGAYSDVAIAGVAAEGFHLL